MLTYITSEEYQELLGKSIPNNFNQLVIEASSYINKMTFSRINQNDIPEEVKYATCLIVDLLNLRDADLKETNTNILKSQNIEGWSETYLTPEEIKANYENEMYSILETYLWNVYGIDNKPLLYKGVDVIG